MLEIGAGAGILTMLFHHDFGAKIVIVDLPEMISFSSACVHYVFPEAKMLLPNEVEGSIDYNEYDFVFLWPNQTNYLSDDGFDLAINSGSMCEMKNSEIAFYFDVIQRVVKNGGLFYCSNRLSKNPHAMGVGDSETREFFKYSWNKENIDLAVDINRFKYEFTDKSFEHLTVDRLQEIVKKYS